MYKFVPHNFLSSVNVSLRFSVFDFSELNETTVVMNLKKRYDQELIYVCLILRIDARHGHDHGLLQFLMIPFSLSL